MTRYDVFNGDADGLCALHQLRLSDPAQTQLVTGTKRDNALLGRVPAIGGDEVTVLDLAMPGNRDALVALLERGVRVRYVDHHEPGELPRHALLDALIDTDPEVCTSVLIDRTLQGAQRPWAVVGAFGDNLAGTAHRLADTIGIDTARRRRWQALGECLNYNAYGLHEDDLVYRPAQLYRALSSYPDPEGFIASEPHFAELSKARASDLEQAVALPPAMRGPGADLYLLPQARWARRVFGSFANHLANLEPRRAHAVLVPRDGDQYLLSLRVPGDSPITAHSVCAAFGGGGRARAAGIDRLAQAQLPAFSEALSKAFAGRAQR